MALTPKRERFCQEYCVDLNGAQAAIRAGFAKSGARQEAARLLANADVQAHITALRAALSERIEVTVEDVQRMLVESYKAARADKQHSAAVRAAELLGRRYGMFIDAVRNDETLSPAEIRRRIAALTAANPHLVDLTTQREARQVAKDNAAPQEKRA